MKLKKKKQNYGDLTEPKSRGKEAEWSGDAKCEDRGSEGENAPQCCQVFVETPNPVGVFLTLSFCLSTDRVGRQVLF